MPTSPPGDGSLDQPNLDLLRAAAGLARLIGEVSMVEPLLEILAEDVYQPVHAAAISALGHIADKRAIPSWWKVAGIAQFKLGFSPCVGS